MCLKTELHSSLQFTQNQLGRGDISAKPCNLATPGRIGMRVMGTGPGRVMRGLPARWALMGVCESVGGRELTAGRRKERWGKREKDEKEKGWERKGQKAGGIRRDIGKWSRLREVGIRGTDETLMEKGRKERRMD